MKMAGLRDLPPELIVVVSESLNLQDICRWATVSRHFYHAIMFSESIAKHALELSAPRALETREGQGRVGLYAQGLRRVMKTLNAIATGAPFHVAFVAMADNFVYTSGMLCYTHGRESIHLVDMHNPSPGEIVIDSRKLLDAAVEVSKSVCHYNFFPIHYAKGILCCRYEHKIERVYSSYVVIIDIPTKSILSSQLIPSRSRYWVGISGALVLVVSREEEAASGQHTWILRCFDIATGVWIHDRIQLDNVSGDMYSNTVCFEIIGDHFYAVSIDPGRFDESTMEWNSTYFVSKHPLNKLSESTKRYFFRRRQQEGPIHDDWSRLKLEQDPETGLPTIFEVRMEWLQAVSPSIRTCYKTAIEFSDESLASGVSVPAPSPGSSTASQARFGSQLLPDLRGPLVRDPRTFHRATLEDTTSYASPGRCSLCAYHPLCEAFVDIVWHESSVTGQQPLQTMRLRTISRPHPESDNVVTVWPPSSGLIGKVKEEYRLLDAMATREHRPALRGVMDDRSIVMTVPTDRRERHGQRTPLLFVSFDPASRVVDRASCGLRTMPINDGKDTSHPSRWPPGGNQELRNASLEGPYVGGTAPWLRTRPCCFDVLMKDGQLVSQNATPDAVTDQAKDN